MKKHLFYTFLTIFVATSLVTLLGITDLVTIKEGYLNALVAAFLVELGGAVIAIFKSTNFFKKEDEEITAEEEIRESIRKLDTVFGHTHDRLNEFQVYVFKELLSAKYLGKTPRTDLQVASHLVEKYSDEISSDTISSLLGTMCDILETDVYIGDSEISNLVSLFNSLPDKFSGLKSRFRKIEKRKFT